MKKCGKVKIKLELHEVDSLIWLVSGQIIKCAPDEELTNYWYQIQLDLEDLRNDIEKQILG